MKHTNAKNTIGALMTVVMLLLNSVTVFAAAPITQNDVLVVSQDGSATINPLINDMDADGDALVILQAGNGIHGTVTFTTGSVTYTPDAGYTGNDRFAYLVSDGNGGQAIGSVAVTVNGTNDAPIAIDDAITVAKNGDVEFNPIINDNDADGDPLTLIATTGSTPNGFSYIISPTRLGYFPDFNFVGTDSFTYTITDGQGSIATATVTVTVTDANTAPFAFDDIVTVAEDASFTFDPRVNDIDDDNDPLVINGTSGALHGTVAFTANDVTYTPAANYFGQDRFGYVIDDGNGGESTATVIIDVTSVNDVPLWAPVATQTFPEDTIATLDLAPLVTDADGDPVLLVVVSSGTNVACTLAGSILTMTPPANFNGADTCIVSADDGQAPAVQQTISITVTPVNDLPIANNDAATTFVDVPVTLDPRVNDTDVDLDVLSIVGVGSATSGVVSFTATDVTYTPNLGFNGTDSFTYTIDDANGGQATATVTVTVSILNNAPVANADSISVAEDGFFTFDPRVNDTDADNDPLIISGVGAASNGSVTFTANDVTYTPAADFNGADSFTYLITDGIANSIATVSVTVTPVNDAPVLAPVPAQSFNEDTPNVVDLVALSSDVDGDALTFIVETQGTNVACSFTGSVLTIIPTSNFSGADSCVVKVNDGMVDSNLQAVSITVNAVNDAPVLAAITAQVFAEDTPTSVDLASFGSDVEGSPLTFSIVTNGANVVCSFAGSLLTMTPPLDFNGANSCVVRVNDGSLDSNMQTVGITVTPVNDAPMVATVLTNVNMIENVITVADLTPLFTDVDNATLTYTATFTGNNVTVVINNSARQAFLTPAAGFVGNQSAVLTFTATDGSLSATSATVDVNVVPDPSPPLSTIINSNLNGNPGITTTANTSTLLSLYDVLVYNSSMDTSSVDNSANSNINNSALLRTNVLNSWVLNSNTVVDSTITNSILNNCVIQNSTIKNIVASNCNFNNSFIDPPSGTNDLTGSTIRNNSVTMNSNVTFSTVDSSTITNSSVTNSTLTGCIVSTSTVGGSTMTNCTIDGSTVTNSTITNSTIVNATVVNAVIIDNVIQSGSLTFNGITYSVPPSAPTALSNIMNFRPTAGFSASAAVITAGGSIQFTDTTTDANIPGPLNDTLTYSWDFGGQGLSGAQSPLFQFVNAGTFLVRLTVTDSFGQSSTTAQSIQVNSPPTPPSGGGGGGGRGGGSSTPPATQPGTYTLDVGATSGGLERTTVTGDVFNFKSEGQDYTLRIIKVGADYVTVQVNAQPERNIILGGTAKFNLDGDDTFDLAVTLKGIVLPKATLLLQLINQKIPNTAVTPLAPATAVTPTTTTTVTPVATSDPLAPVTEPVTQPAKAPWKFPAVSPTATGIGIVAIIILFGLLMYGIVRKLVIGSPYNS